MANTTVNKVVLGNETLIDLTPVTVTADKLASGYTALDASGALITGALDPNQGSAYQDADGYVVLDEGESTVPQGTLAITANGSYNVADYAGATVDVVKTYTATISGNGNNSKCCVLKVGDETKHYTDGDTFTFTEHDDLEIRFAGPSGSYKGYVTVNGTQTEFTGTYIKTYIVSKPRSDLTIELSYSTSSDTYVNIVIPSALVGDIDGGGMRNVGGYSFANVRGMSETDLTNYIERSTQFSDITWPSGITKIGDYAFANCTYFNPASLPSTVTTIGIYAFYCNTRLALTSLPSNVTSIGNYAFYQCTYLALTSLPSGLTKISDYSFQSCPNISLTSLPSGITSIGSLGFFDCNKLTLTSLPSGLTSISSSAFQSCENLALTSLPSSLTGIGSQAFQDCCKITISELPIGVTVLSSSAFCGCTSITSIRSDAVITAANSQFMVGNGINKTMSLTSASFPNMTVPNVTTLFGSTTAAYACQLLEFCDLGSAKAIVANAFANCNALETLVLRRSDAICTLSNVSAFLNTPMSGYNSLTGTVYVPSSLISSYQTATNWKTLYDAGTVTFAAIEGSDYELE